MSSKGVRTDSVQTPRARRTDTDKLDILFFKEQGVWVGQCLQHNIAVQGETLRECIEALFCVLVGRIVIAAKLGMDHPFKGVPPAPAKYWKRYPGALKLSPEESTFKLPKGIPPAFMIQPSNLELRIYG